MSKAEFGSIISGTMDYEELGPAFIDEIERITGENQDTLRAEYDSMAEDPTANEDIICFVDELFDTLNEYAPDYGYFGAHMGDGADYGFWPIENIVETMREDGVEIYSDLCEVKTQPIAIVNDHGNLTYGYLDTDGFHTVWAIV